MADKFALLIRCFYTSSEYSEWKKEESSKSACLLMFMWLFRMSDSNTLTHYACGMRYTSDNTCTIKMLW